MGNGMFSRGMSGCTMNTVPRHSLVLCMPFHADASGLLDVKIVYILYIVYAKELPSLCTSPPLLYISLEQRFRVIRTRPNH